MIFLLRNENSVESSFPRKKNQPQGGRMSRSLYIVTRGPLYLILALPSYASKWPLAGGNAQNGHRAFDFIFRGHGGSAHMRSAERSARRWKLEYNTISVYLSCCRHDRVEDIIHYIT